MVAPLVIKEIDKSYSDDLTQFLDQAGNSISTFRYFEKRSFDILDNHNVTLLAYLDGNPVGYGHLDTEGNKTWLGIAIIDSMTGKGLGKKIMTYLTNHADSQQLEEIHLSVDTINKGAIHLYQKFGFSIITEKNHILFMKRTL